MQCEQRPTLPSSCPTPYASLCSRCWAQRVIRKPDSVFVVVRRRHVLNAGSMTTNPMLFSLSFHSPRSRLPLSVSVCVNVAAERAADVCARARRAARHRPRTRIIYSCFVLFWFFARNDKVDNICAFAKHELRRFRTTRRRRRSTCPTRLPQLRLPLVSDFRFRFRFAIEIRHSISTIFRSFSLRRASDTKCDNGRSMFVFFFFFFCLFPTFVFLKTRRRSRATCFGNDSSAHTPIRIGAAIFNLF
jgi:hypothetical protein